METLGVNMTTRQFFFHPLALGGRDRDPSRFSLRRHFCPRISRRRPSPSRLAGDAPIVVVWLPLLLSVRLLVGQSFASPCLLAETWWLLARSEACLEPESESRILTSFARDSGSNPIRVRFSEQRWYFRIDSDMGWLLI